MDRNKQLYERLRKELEKNKILLKEAETLEEWKKGTKELMETSQDIMNQSSEILKQNMVLKAIMEKNFTEAERLRSMELKDFKAWLESLD